MKSVLLFSHRKRLSRLAWSAGLSIEEESVVVAWSGLRSGRYLLAPLILNEQECKGLMVLLARHTPTRFPTPVNGR